MDWKRTFLKQLEQEMEEFKEDSKFLEAEGKNPDTIRFLFGIGEEDGDMAVMDVAVYALENGINLLQFYTVVVSEVEEEVLPTLLPHINQLNLPVPLGAFGYLAEEKQVYHKYNMVVDEPTDMDTFVTHAVSYMAFILNILDSCCEELYEAAGF